MLETNPLRDRDRVRRILRREGPGELALDAPGPGTYRGRLRQTDLPEDWLDYLEHGEFVRLTTTDGSDRREVFEPYLPGLPETAHVSEWGVGRVALKSTDGEHAGHQYWHPLARMETVEELDAYPWPEVDWGRSVEELAALTSSWQAKGFTVVGQMSQTILETAYLMRGMDRLLLDLYESPEFAQALFGQLCVRRASQARRYAEAGVDVVRIGDDIATQTGLFLSPKLYREQLQPHHARAVAAARASKPDLPVLYHSDGNLTELLPDLLDLGVTAINPVQPECMDVLAISARYGDRLTLWGCTPVQSTFADGPADEVLTATQWLSRQVPARHGLILNFINLIPTDRAAKNLVTCGEELRRLWPG